MNTTLEALAPVLQDLFGASADAAARSCAFIKRKKLFSGASFLQTCVFTWIENPDATLEQFTVTAASLGVDVSRQAIDQRLDDAGEFFRRMLQGSVQHLFTASGRALPLLERFNGVYLDDASHIGLPAELADKFPGCGGSTATAGAATMKIMLRWEVQSGQVANLDVSSSRRADTTLADELPPLPQGALRLADLGFFKIQMLRDLAKEGVFFITKLKQGSTLRIEGRRIEDLAAWLNEQGASRVDANAELGGNSRTKGLPCRLVVMRLSEEQAAERREKVRKEAQAKGYKVSEQALALCDWLVVITNVPRKMLSGKEVLEVYRVRWQVELVFKTWKSELKVDEWRTQKVGRIEAEIYGKLLGAVVQSWLTLLSWVQGPAKSMRRIMKGMKGLVAKAMWQLARTGAAGLVATLAVALPGLRRLGTLQKSKKEKGKGTFQRLEDLRRQRSANQSAPLAGAIPSPTLT
jgi:hypothetical protein